METVSVPVAELRIGDKILMDERVVLVLRVQRDRMGFDLLYAPQGEEPRWRGYDDSDKAERVSP